MVSGRGVTPLVGWARQSAAIRNSNINSALAEFVGMFIFLVFAVGAGCQAQIIGPAMGPGAIFFMGLIGTVLGLMVGIVTVGGVSGAHLNPAVTLAVAISGGISWVKVPIYWLAQFFGAYIGSGIAYWLYTRGLKDAYPACADDLTDCHGLAAVFAPPPHDNVGVAFADQVLGTFLLVILILAACDSRNMKVPSSCYGPLFAVTVAGINCAFGIQAGGVLNSARDIGARLMAVSVGYPSDNVFVLKSGDSNYQYWVAPLLGPMVGGILAALIYTFAVAAHLKDPHGELEEYVPNRFRAQLQPTQYSVQNEYHPQSQGVYAPSSQKSYAMQGPPAVPYRSGH